MRTLKQFIQERWILAVGFLTSFLYVNHYFAAHPWHTVDGLLFCAAAAYALSKERFYLAFVCAFLAALTKQSYYPAPLIVGALFLLQSHGSHYVRRYAMFALLLLGLAISLWMVGDVQAFLRLSHQTGTMQELVQAGIIEYLPRLELVYVVVLLLAWDVFRWSKRYSNPGSAWVMVVLTAVPLSFALWLGFIYYAFGHVRDVLMLAPGTTQFVFLCALLPFAKALITERNLTFFHKTEHTVPLFLFASAWMSSLSWGYMNLMFAMGFVVTGLLITVRQHDLSRMRLFIMLMLLITALLFLAIRLYYPARTGSLMQEPHVWGKEGYYQGIYMDKKAQDKIEELKVLATRYPCLVVLPSFPQSSLILGQIPPTRADWKMDIEYVSQQEEWPRLVARGCYFAVETDPQLEGFKTGKFKSSIYDLVIKEGIKVEEQRFFVLYTLKAR